MKNLCKDEFRGESVMNLKKIIFFDIDGTIYSPSSKMVSKHVRDAIQKTMQLGHLCFISSGRPYSYLDSTIKEIGFDGYILASGAHIQYQNKDIQINAIESDIVNELLLLLKNNQIEYVVHTPFASYMHETFIAQSNFYKTNQEYLMISNDMIEKEIMDKVVKLEVHYDTAQHFHLLKSYCQILSYEVYHEIDSIDFFKKGHSKASAIKNLLNVVDGSIENTYCFGDGENDIEMFDIISYPIAMENAIDELKKKAKEICKSVDEDGVAYKLQELFQIK